MWESFASRVVPNTQRLLALTARHGVRGTFFVLGWVAQRYPQLVREIRSHGHEIGCHSYWHRLIYALDPEEFRKDTLSAKAAIEDACGAPICCYRAPTFSITRKSLWALEILAECGFTIDSSIFPIHHDNYGVPRSPRFPYEISTASGSLLEFPISTMQAFGATWPVAGGGYLRMLPLWYNRTGIDSIAANGGAAMVYVHPWEIDPGQPRIKTRLRSRLRHYTALASMEGKLDALMQRYRFAPISEVVKHGRVGSYSVDVHAGELTPVVAG